MVRKHIIGWIIFVAVVGTYTYSVSFPATEAKAIAAPVEMTSAEDSPALFTKAVFFAESSCRVDVPPGDRYYQAGPKKGTLKPSTDWSYGPFQIGKRFVADYNGAHKTSYRAEDMHQNYPLSYEVFWGYQNMYATEKRLGHKPTFEDRARIHNGGLFGCFDNGAIDKDGTLLKDVKKRAALAQCQRNAKRYWLTHVKPALERFE